MPGVLIMSKEMKSKTKYDFFKELFEAHYNGGISIKVLAKRENISERTLYRQFNIIKNGFLEGEQPKNTRTGRPPKFNDK